MNIESWFSMIAIAASFISLTLASIVAIKSWYKSRVIYELEEFVLRKIDGSRDDKENRGLAEINSKLKTGKYSIQAIQNRPDGDWAIILSRVKKDKNQ